MNGLYSFFVVTLVLSTVSAQTTPAINQVVDGPCSRFQVVNQQPFFKKLFTLDAAKVIHYMRKQFYDKSKLTRVFLSNKLRYLRYRYARQEYSLHIQAEGTCRKTVTELTGNWYLYATYDYGDIEGLDCLTLFYLLTPDGNIRNTERGKNLMTNARTTFQTTLFFNQPGVGQYLNDGTGSDAEVIQIAITDYMHYYIEFSCSDIADGKADAYVAVYTRTPFPSPVVVSLINNYINTHNIDTTRLRYINHDKTRCIF